MCLDTGVAPAVGYSRTLTLANVNTPGVNNDWNLLESQAAMLTNIELVVKGTIDGRQRGFVFQPAQNNYRADTTNLAPMTRAALRDKVLAGDTLTILGMPPGAGTRAGIDRNADGILDGDVSAPLLRIADSASTAVISWPTNAGGFVLERVGQLPSTNWRVDTTIRGISGADFNVTNSFSISNLFFRLREL
jgi:hypothetical protein